MLSKMLRAASKSAKVEFISAYYDDVDRSSSYTFSSIPVTPGLIVVAVHIDYATHTITSVNIDGSASTYVIGLQNSSTQDAAIYQRRTTTNGNISVVVNFTSSGALTRCGIAVWRIYDNQNDTVFTTGSSNGTAPSSLSNTLNNLPLNSVAIAASTHGTGGVTSSWSGVTERYDSARETTGSQFSGGDGSKLQENVTITDTYSSATGGAVVVSAAWR